VLKGELHDPNFVSSILRSPMVDVQYEQARPVEYNNKTKHAVSATWHLNP